jgi:hypothetical protein
MKKFHNGTLRLSQIIVVILTGFMLFIMASTVIAGPHYPPNEYTIPLQDQWNLITIPVNATITTEQITIRNNSIDYTFSEAVANGIIVMPLFGWDRENQTYFPVSGPVLKPGQGYWLWAYYNCSMIILSDVRGDGYITSLQTGWNIMGQTYNTTLALEKLTVLYNGTAYSWVNATSSNNEEGQPLIINTIFNWNSAIQSYGLTTKLTPSEGDWIYAYFNCSLRQEIHPPVIIDNSAESTGTGNTFVCNASVSDPDGVDSVWLKYWYGANPYSFVEMNPTGVDSYYETLLTIPSASLDSLHYIIAANDTKNHWNATIERTVNVYDDDAPIITNVLASPSSVLQGEYVNISCDVVDNIAINTVRLHITYPDLSTENLSMTEETDYYVNQSYSMSGTYEFFIWVNDTSNNSIVSSDHTFTVTATTYTITASAGEGGTIDPSGDIVVDPGDSVNFTITADIDYHIADVLVDSITVGVRSWYNFTNVQADHTISAVFEPTLTFTITASTGPGGSISPSGDVIVDEGSYKNFTITANTGYHVADVLVDSVSMGIRSWYNFTDIQSDHTISASFAINQYTITASAGSGGSITPSGEVVVNYGAYQNFSITPNTGYHVADVLVDSISVGARSWYNFTNVVDNHTIAASFALNTYTITASAGTGGTIDPSGDVSVLHGSYKNFTITANTNYHILDVIVDSVSMGVRPWYNFTNIVDNHTIAASFTINTYIINASAGEGGTIDPSGNVSVPHGSYKNFTITADTDYHIADVLVDSITVGARSWYNFTNVQADHTISAVFEPTLTFTITASAGPGGSISPSGDVIVDQGSYKNFTITKDTGYHITDVLVDSVSQGIRTWYNFTNVQTDHAIAVSFAINQYTITASAGSGGSITPSGEVVVNYGAYQNFSITPNTGYHVADVLVDSISVGARSWYNFTNVQMNHTISASFALNPTFTITASAGEGGTIDPSGDIVVDPGDSVNFTITADIDYHITDVLVDSISVGIRSWYNFTNVQADHTISAVFEPTLTYWIIASAGPGGTIDPSGDVIVDEGSYKNFTITPNTNYRILDVIVDSVSKGARTWYNFTNVHEDHAITATFQDNTPPTITLNFAGNTGDLGGPYYRPPGETWKLTNNTAWAKGYYTTNSKQSEAWIYINLTVNDAQSSVTNVWLQWLNVTGTTSIWTNYSYAFTQKAGNYWMINTSATSIQTKAGSNYSFNIVANSSGGSTNIAWNKTMMYGDYGANNIQRRYVQLNCTPVNIAYTPYYFYQPTGLYNSPNDNYRKDRLHHDQGTDGTTSDVGYLWDNIPTATVQERNCLWYLGFWFDESVCVSPFSLTNTYVHYWFTHNNVDSDATVRLSKGQGNVTMSTLTTLQSQPVKFSDNKSSIVYNAATYRLDARKLSFSPQTITDNNIYELIMVFRTDVYGKNPKVISNRSFTSFIIFNVPSNATLNTSYVDSDGDQLSDWYELYRSYTNPFLADTDNDGVTDYCETLSGSDPNDYKDTINPFPMLSSESPQNHSADQPLNPSLSITVSQAKGQLMNITFRTNATGSWETIGTNATVSNGTYRQQPSTMNSYSTTYYWSVHCNVGNLWTNKTYHFTTQAPPVNDPPLITNPIPANSSTNNPLSLTWSISINDPEGDPFSWTIQCNNGQTNSGTTESNGTKSIALSGLTYSTTYTIWVNATDPTGSGLYTRQWYIFTTRASRPPVLSTPAPANESTNIPITTTELSITIQDPDGDPFNWIITTSPNIGSSSGTGATNGTKSCPITGLTYDTTYTWTVKATDGYSWTNRTYHFTTFVGPRGWIYYKKLTVNHLLVNQSLRNFPILVSITDSDLKNHAQSTAWDVQFWDATNTTRYHHEIEKYDQTTGALTAWVNITYLSATQDTIIWMKYGNTTCPSQENIAGTWNGDYLMVQHLNETGNTLYDSTAYGRHGTNSGTTQTSGKIDGGRQYDDDDYINVTTFGGYTNQLTAEAWVYRNSTTQVINIFCEGTHYDKSDWVLYLIPSSQTIGIDFGINNHSGSGNYLRVGYTPANTWFYLTAVYNAGNISIYLNKTRLGSKNIASTINNYFTGLGLGNDNNGGQPWTAGGKLDELRVSKKARNSSWINTTYNTIYQPASFITLSSEAEITLSLTVTQNGTGSGTVEHQPNGPYRYGAVVTLWANASADSFFKGWSGALSGTTTPQNLIMTENMAVNAEFASNSYTITASAGSGGSINPSGEVSVDYGDSINFTITPDAGYHITDVLVDGGSVGVRTWYNFINVQADHTISASFLANQAPVFSSVTPADDLANVDINTASVSVYISDPEGDQLDWTIEGVYVVDASGNNEGNGTKSASLITPLPYSTNVIWYVNATDGSLWTRMVYDFTTRASRPPVLSTPAPANESTNIPITTTELSITIQDPDGDFFNWIITTSPNIGSNSGTGATNGTKSCPVSGLTYDTIYTWAVKATDGYTWTNRTYHFTTFVGPRGWIYYKKITVNHLLVNQSLVNFPILVSITDSDLKNHAQSTAGDVQFWDATNTTRYHHEIEKYDQTTGQLLAWVNVTHLSATQDTVIWMKYGNTTCGSQENIAGTWNSDYLMVQHLNESGNTLYDSTAYGKNGVNTGTTQTSGKIDGGRQYDDNDYINVSNFGGYTNQLTAEAWVYRNSTTQFINIFNEGTAYNKNDWILYLNTLSTTQGIDFGINNHTAGNYLRAGYTPAGEWFYLTAVYNAGNILLYVNSTKLGSGTIGSTINNYNNVLGLGNDNDGGQPWASGKLDELRISKTARNSSWIKTSYNTIYQPASFITLSSEAEITLSLTVTQNGTGSGTVEYRPHGLYYYGAIVTLWANASVGSTFSGWSGALSGTITPQNLIITGNMAMNAEFTLNTYTITASAGSGGSINPSGAVIVNYGADQTFSITSEDDYHIKDVVVDSISQGALSSYTFYTVDADHSISASFEIDTFTLTASPYNSTVINLTFTKGPSTDKTYIEWKDHGALNLIPYGFQTYGTGTAGWTSEAFHTGTCSVKLTTTQLGDYAAASVAYNAAFSDLDTVSYWYNHTAYDTYAGPRLSIGIDNDTDGTIDHLVISSSVNQTGAWAQLTLPTDNDHWWYGSYDPDTGIYTQDGGPVTFASIKSNYSSADVLYLTFYMGVVDGTNVGAGNAYVDDIVINGVDAMWERGTGTLLYNGTGTTYADTGRSPATTYFYQAWSWNETDCMFNAISVADDATTFES